MSERVLVIGAHVDDIEFMCGGTIVKLLDHNCEIFYTTFSFAIKSLPPGYPQGTTKKEVSEAASVLGIDVANIFTFDYNVRTFSNYRQDILDKLIDLKKEIRPQVVISHNADDTHQDHKVVAEETFRAFKKCSTIWGYESCYNNRVFNNDLYVKLKKEHIDKKIEAISKYKSQIVKHDNREAIIGLAKFRGGQIRQDYAECFQVLRYIL